MLATSEHGQLFKQIIYCVGGQTQKLFCNMNLKIKTTNGTATWTEKISLFVINTIVCFN